jgi:flagellar protein FlaJ
MKLNLNAFTEKFFKEYFKYYKKLSIKYFGKFADRSLNNYDFLEKQLHGAGISMLLKAWVSMIYMTVSLVYVLSLLIVLVVSPFMALGVIDFLYYVIFLPILIASLAFVAMYLYPAQRAKSAKKSIDSNLPFALIHMSAIVSSGIPPEFMFHIMSKFKDYGKITDQMKRIVRNMKTFGMSSVAAVNNVAKTTPSKELRQILGGISSTIEKGGDLSYYLKEMSEKTLFDYRIEREKHSKTLSVLSDVYTALLITGPLMIISVIVMMNMIGGDVFGLTAADAMLLMVAIVAAANIIYLLFLEVTYPG